MPDKDHLDNEIAVSAELTASGVKAKAKSRALSALDRLVGNLVDWANVRLERDLTVKRAKIDGEKLLLEAVSRHGVQKLNVDAEFANRAIEAHFRDVLGRQENREGVAREAIADLERLPPNVEEANSGSETIDETVLDRLNGYAASASTAELRQKWGRVLASEIRRPGSISLKVLRLVDELEPTTALLFERVCKFRLGASIPVACIPKLTDAERVELTSAGLIVPSELGHSIPLRTLQDSEGQDWHALLFSNRALIVPFETALKPQPIGRGVDALELVNKRLQMPVLALTREGLAISSILPYDEDVAIDALVEEIRKLVPATKTASRQGQTGEFRDDPVPSHTAEAEKQ